MRVIIIPVKQHLHISQPLKLNLSRNGMMYRASGPGSGAESPLSRGTGRGRKGGHSLARHAAHVRTFVANLALNHSQTCFWVGVSYIAEKLPRCGLLKASP